jgi:hypothetical protein
MLAMTIGIDVITAVTTATMTGVTTTTAMTAMIGVTTTEAIVVMIAMMIVTTTDMMIDVARMTTILRTVTGRSRRRRHRPKGKPQWCIPEGWPRDQLHRWRLPSDQKQPTYSIKRQGDRARQHRKPATSAVV